MLLGLVLISLKSASSTKMISNFGCIVFNASYFSYIFSAIILSKTMESSVSLFENASVTIFWLFYFIISFVFTSNFSLASTYNVDWLSFGFILPVVKISLKFGISFLSLKLFCRSFLPLSINLLIVSKRVDLFLIDHL